MIKVDGQLRVPGVPTICVQWMENNNNRLWLWLRGGVTGRRVMTDHVVSAARRCHQRLQRGPRGSGGPHWRRC